MIVDPYLRIVAVALLNRRKEQGNGRLTDEDIHECVARAIDTVQPDTTNQEREDLISELQRSNKTWIGTVRSLTSEDGNWRKWLDKESSQIDWRYWRRYRTYLLSLPRPLSVVDAIDAATEETLGNLNYPRQPGQWDRRGMVVGHVQSGKTANYVGLICKAADAGYKVIIVLTGFHNNLRTQTQIRLEEGFLGFNRYMDSNEIRSEAVGVGLIDSDPLLRPDTITTRAENGDFNKAVAKNFGRNLGDRPLLFIIKKNASVLKNLIEYLEWAKNDSDEDGRPLISGIPLLLIDDEADQGSVDTKKMDVDEEGEPNPEHDPTTLNRLIRKVLYMFSQSAYVGYTATPFANIFIHSQARTNELGDDLFPRSFITVIPTPSDYVGPDKVFGLADDDPDVTREGLPIIRPIDDYANSKGLNERQGWMPPKHDKNHVPTVDGEDRVPDSLRRAIIVFILGCAARLQRGQGARHTSMLVHVTRFVNVQHRVTVQIDNFLRDIRNDVLYGTDKYSRKLVDEFPHIWRNDFEPTTNRLSDESCPAITWPEVEVFLKQAILSIRVKQINGTAGDVLDYARHEQTGLNVIVVGGDKLSRGLTLEGLTVSYFTRPTKMYDTLMQMGRWFGYRYGFLDLCRLYAPSVLINWFGHIADASEELRRDFVLMHETGGTPASYGQRVRSHPVLLVTSQVKSRHAIQLQLSYSGVISETIVFSRDAESVQANYAAAERLILALGGAEASVSSPKHKSASVPSKGKFLWQDVRHSEITRFLSEYTGADHVRRVNTDLLSQYIDKQVAQEYLTTWSVMLAGKEPDHDFEIGGCSTGCLERAIHPSQRSHNSTSNSYRIRRLVSPTDEAWDLHATEFREALRLTRQHKKDARRPGGPEIRSQRNRGNALLMLYPLEVQEGGEPEGLHGNVPYIGFAISFPGLKHDVPITYQVNTVYQGQIDD